MAADTKRDARPASVASPGGAVGVEGVAGGCRGSARCGAGGSGGGSLPCCALLGVAAALDSGSAAACKSRSERSASMSVETPAPRAAEPTKGNPFASRRATPGSCSDAAGSIATSTVLCASAPDTTARFAAACLPRSEASSWSATRGHMSARPVPPAVTTRRLTMERMAWSTTTRSASEQAHGQPSGTPLCSCAPRCWLRQCAQNEWPHGRTCTAAAMRRAHMGHARQSSSASSIARCCRPWCSSRSPTSVCHDAPPVRPLCASPPEPRMCTGSGSNRDPDAERLRCDVDRTALSPLLHGLPALAPATLRAGPRRMHGCVSTAASMPSPLSPCASVACGDDMLTSRDSRHAIVLCSAVVAACTFARCALHTAGHTVVVTRGSIETSTAGMNEAMMAVRTGMYTVGHRRNGTWASMGDA
eukprot:359188-Chlamydomonas_euryale.AAC.23